MLSFDGPIPDMSSTPPLMPSLSPGLGPSWDTANKARKRGVSVLSLGTDSKEELDEDALVKQFVQDLPDLSYMLQR